MTYSSIRTRVMKKLKVCFKYSKSLNKVKRSLYRSLGVLNRHSENDLKLTFIPKVLQIKANSVWSYSVTISYIILLYHFRKSTFITYKAFSEYFLSH